MITADPNMLTSDPNMLANLTSAVNLCKALFPSMLNLIAAVPYTLFLDVALFPSMLNAHLLAVTGPIKLSRTIYDSDRCCRTKMRIEPLTP